jgi:hypothetical protein
MASETASTAPKSDENQRRLFAFLVIAVVALGFANFSLLIDSRPLPKSNANEAPSERSFDGASERLANTVIVPTLQRPIPPGKSVVWCATMPAAWQALEKSAHKGPLMLEGDEAISHELSSSAPPELEPEHYYTFGGFVREGAAERIRQDMATRFPGVKIPVWSNNPDLAIGYAYLEVTMRFELFFEHHSEPMTFKDGRGGEAKVHAFGIREKDHGKSGMREQVLVLFREGGQFALDLSGGTKPYQMILARIECKGTLQESLDHVEARIKQARPKHLNNAAILTVPSMNWRVEHRFRELEKPSANGLIVEAAQSIQFKMDRKGVVLASEAMIHDWQNGHPNEPHPDHYPFDRPFLILMKKRDGRNPFFVMWVDNAELMQRR